MLAFFQTFPVSNLDLAWTQETEVICFVVSDHSGVRPEMLNKDCDQIQVEEFCLEI